MNKKYLTLMLLASAMTTNIQGQDISFQNAFPNLSFNSPIDFQIAGEVADTIFVVERAGAIQRFRNDSETDEMLEVLDIRSRVSTRGEGGLLGIAFHPDFMENGYLFAHYTATDPFRSVFARFETDPENALLFDPDSESIIFEVDQPARNHNAGQIRFGPDGYLYIALGDGGGGGDPDENGQDRTTLHGNILRIDVDNTDEGLNYAIPADNPFVDNEEGWWEEIFAWGFRNPFRFSFDSETGKLWVADVGQRDREEVNIVEAGKNYGWNIMEGSICFPPSSECDTTGLELPVHEYGFSGGQSITGGFVYRGDAAPEQQGRYFYGDFVTGDLWSFDFDGEGAFDNRSIGEVSPYQLVCFGEDHDRELYMCLMGQGHIYRIVMEQEPVFADADPAFPETVTLEQNYPNPFNPSTVIRYELSEPAQVSLEVFDVLGRSVAVLMDEFQSSGGYDVTFDASTLSGGIYLYQLTAGDRTLTRTMTLVK
ncbi:MAG: T9SS C-terminal target domain-containing protein [Balneolaceae bacterium]|nr:MAG: T9SS C-terminal target domain-containing protein [Balneolaceae bacterium]